MERVIEQTPFFTVEKDTLPSSPMFVFHRLGNSLIHESDSEDTNCNIETATTEKVRRGTEKRVVAVGFMMGRYGNRNAEGLSGTKCPRCGYQDICNIYFCLKCEHRLASNQPVLTYF